MAINGPKKDDGGLVPRSPAWYWAPLIIVGLLYIFVGLVLVFTDEPTGLVRWMGYIVWGIGLFHYGTGIKTIPVDTVLAVFFLGKAAISRTSTFLILPAGMYRYVPVSLRTFQREFPAEPDKIYHGQEPAVPSGLRPPIRITFSDKKGAYKITDDLTLDNTGIADNDPAQTRSTQEVSTYVRWRVLDPFNYLRNIGSEVEAEKQLEDTMGRFLTEVLPQVTLAVAIQNIGKLNEVLEQRVQKSVELWGIDIIDAIIKSTNLSYSFNVAIQNRATAEADKQATVTRAEGARQATVLAAQGEAEGEKTKLEKRGEGLKNMAESLNISGEEALAATTAQTILSGVEQTLIVGAADGLRDLIAAGRALTGNTKKKEE